MSFNEVIHYYPDLEPYKEIFEFMEAVRREISSIRDKLDERKRIEFMQVMFNIQKEKLAHAHGYEIFKDILFSDIQNIIHLTQFPRGDYHPMSIVKFDTPVHVGKFRICLRNNWICAVLCNSRGVQYNAERTQAWFDRTCQMYEDHLRPDCAPNDTAAVHVSIMRTRYIDSTRIREEQLKQLVACEGIFNLYAYGIATGFSFNFTNFSWFNALIVESPQIESFKKNLTSLDPTVDEFLINRLHVTIACCKR